MKRLRYAFLAAIGLAGLIWLCSATRRIPTLATEDARPSINPLATGATANEARADRESVSGRDAPREEIRRRLADTARVLGTTADTTAVRAMLAELRAYLRSIPSPIASVAICDFLEENLDATTRLDFTVDNDGNLKGAPTLRVFLLDQLSQIAPETAAGYARTILETYRSADEWAISLRNYARAKTGDDDREFVLRKTREMIHHAPWQQKPSAGYLEAFDAIVYARGTVLTPDLAQLVSKKDNQAVAHAAYLTLDRLVLLDPAEVLRQLQEQPELMAGREETRANYFARTNVRDPAQRALLETYLLDSRRTREEIATFSGLFPNANYMISSNLLTSTQTPGHAELAARDRAALDVVRTWLDDPRFLPLQPELARISARLETFVKQADATK